MMDPTAKPGKIERLISDLDRLIAAAEKYAEKHEEELNLVHRRYRSSAANLLHYTAIRSRDLSRIQKRLRNMGLSRLAKAESHVMPSLIATRNILTALLDEPHDHYVSPDLSIKKSKRRLKKHVRKLLGKRPEGRNSRIMVTMPATAAHDKELIRGMLLCGMNVARINCAHDDEMVWLSIIENIREIATQLDVPCAIAMDLAGPKIRTGKIEPGPKIRKIRPKKNVRGQIIEPAMIRMADETLLGERMVLPVDGWRKLKAGEILYFRDTRNKKRKITIISTDQDGCVGEIGKTSYFETGMLLYNEPQLIHPRATVGELPAKEGSIYINAGDLLRIVRDPLTAQHCSMGENAQGAPCQIHCTNPEALQQAMEGERVLLDDGKFEGIIVAKDEGGLTLEIQVVRNGGTRLRADKGINFPDSNLTVAGLTEKDRVDLEFVVKHADIVNMSFVNSPSDVHDLMDALDAAGSDLGVILKIETRQAFRNLVPILLAAMKTYPIGVMIARGDLALEVGWKSLAAVQREIMKICHAAHVPDIWATQVFETLAKTGVPSRAEMTDVWVAQRSECVMLNKGPYILDAIKLLNAILTKLDVYHDKDSALLPSLKKVSG